MVSTSRSLLAVRTMDSGNLGSKIQSTLERWGISSSLSLALSPPPPSPNFGAMF